MQLLNDLVKFLANSPGNYVFILAVSFTLIGLFQGALGSYRNFKSDTAKRQLIGLGILLLIQLLLFFTSGLFEQEVIKQSNYLPILDRTVLLLSLVWLIWLWVFPENNRFGDFGIIIINLLIGSFCILNITNLQTAQIINGSYNISEQALYYNIAGIIALTAGLLLIIIRKKESWEIGLVFFLMIIAGILFDTFMPEESGNYSGIIRFFMLAAFPLLFSLTSRIYKFPSQADYLQLPENALNNTNNPISKQSRASALSVQDKRKYSADPGTLQSLFLLASEIDISKINLLLTKSISQALLVDLCFLIYADDVSENLYISGGYDLIKEETLEGGNIKKLNFPVISNSLENNLFSFISINNAASDVSGLQELLGLPNIGNTLFVPIQADKKAVGGILLLSPYSFREWDADEQAFLGKIAASIAPIIVRGQIDKKRSNDYVQVKQKLDDQIEKARSLEILNEDLELQLLEFSKKLEKTQKELSTLNELLTSGKDDARNPENNQFIVDHSELEQKNDRINQLETELKNIQMELFALQEKYNKFNNPSSQENDGSQINEQADVIVSISQELRQPMSSIIGYADLLLGESVGILGALQRKFIERIRTSTERLGSLTDDLIHISMNETNQISQNKQTIDLNQVIDNAMTYTSSQMREKNIALRLDIPENLQSLLIDKEVIQQILIYLLQNAGSASPVEGSVTIRVRNEVENGINQIIIQVSDTGGGIPESEFSRLFSRFYRAENALIPGIGDKGVGLSLAKALTESQGGTILVDSEIGIGSTFSVKLPVGISIISTTKPGDA